MKRIVFALGLVAATSFAAPLAAQSRNDGPWYDPANTGTRSGDTRDNRNGTIYDRNGQVNDRNGQVYGNNSRVDGRWHTAGRDRSGNTIYVRNRYDSNGNVIQEAARRNRLGQYRVFDRRVVQYASNRNNRNDGRVYGRNDNDRNDRWDQNNGHDNGRHNGKYKDKNKNKGRRD